MGNQKVTQAFVVAGTTPPPTQGVEQIALYSSAGTPLSFPETGAQVLLTGYTSHAVGAVAAADSVNLAIAKLEARIAVLEA